MSGAEYPNTVDRFAHGLVLSPMAGITDLSYRQLCRRYGAEITFTEMVSVEGLVRGAKKCERYLHSDELDRPFGVQLLGNRPEALAEAAEIIQDKVRPDIIDINMGCPVPKVVRSGMGSALMKDPEHIRAALAALRKVVKCPLTIKMRAGWSDGNVNAGEVLKIAEGEGVDVATIHTRTRSQMFNGKADWDLYWRLRENTKLPLVANGDIVSAQSYAEKTAKDPSIGVMVARGAIGNPYVFAEIQAWRAGKVYTPPEPWQRARDMLLLAEDTISREGERSMRRLRRVLLAFARPFPGYKLLREKIAHVSTLDQLSEALAPWRERV